MAAPPAPRRRGEGVFRLLHALGAGCGTLPLVAGVALVLSARAVPLLAAPEAVRLAEPTRFEGASPDATLIDAVLAKRAPELGLTLRRQIVQAIAEEAGKAGYDPLLILALIDVESDFAEEAISEKGARGLMQIKPSTLHFLAEKEGLRLSREEVAADPSLGVRLGIRYLRALNDRFGDLELALMAYNAGPTRIWQAKKAGELDTFRRYPRLVRREFKRFREGEGLGGDWALAQREGLENVPEQKTP
ncbi:lytic transglycosylase domain-containing protein [Archangium primigenium]|uniref:lytic transglycosylase domain-containing protein n=1 Tax=[Archangium] primigenium TaxID=2792470 RepID=UPI0019560D9E|nr:lytic transglycosylase domain-containing protein [Archangium primigenium]MBM7115437.1 lytic transglycosylase domain-containing protein [Archangium primigenium]